MMKKKRFLSTKGFTPSETMGRRRRDLMSQAGFTLMEVMFAAGILVTALLGILLTYITCFELISSAQNLTLATNAIQGEIEEIRGYNFFDIYANYDSQTFGVNEMPLGNSMGVIYVRKADGSACVSDDDCGELKQVIISVCWRQRGNRIMGEDLNLDGALDAGEDSNNNGIIDSPAQLVTLITAR